MPDTPPPEVIRAFLRVLSRTVSEFNCRDLAVVLRGSFLLHEWYGEKARPAGDIDLECFAIPAQWDTPDEERQQWVLDGFGEWGEYSTLVDYGKAMCRYAAESTGHYRWRDESQPDIEFSEVEAPEDGASLWVYGTPGERYITGWSWHGQKKLLSEAPKGTLQIDIAQAGEYSLPDIRVESISFQHADNVESDQITYTREMMLAAKLSWLMRSFLRPPTEDNSARLVWMGQPKDLFDAHLIVTEGGLDATSFQKCLMAVGTDDKLEWNSLGLLFETRRGNLTDADFGNWGEFAAEHEGLVTKSASQTLSELAKGLEPLLGDFYPPGEESFLLAVTDEAAHEFDFLTYADFLEEQGSPRASFLRLFSSVYFHSRDMAEPQLGDTRRALLASLRATSEPWLHRLFGSAERLAEMQKRIEDQVL